MAGKAVTQSISQYFLGTCMISSKQTAAKVRISQFVLDKYINMYFKESKIIYANDPHRICKTGDIVLTKLLPEKLTRLITHEIIEVIYPLGDITDPITGKKVIASKYREHVDEDIKLFGKNDKWFDYSKAPRRGRLENTRDFSHRKLYLKYHNNPDNPQNKI